MSTAPEPLENDAFGRPSRAVRSGWDSLDDALRARTSKGSSLTGVEATLAALQARLTAPAGPCNGIYGAAERGAHGAAERGACSQARGLVRGGVHEWFGTSAAATSTTVGATSAGATSTGAGRRSRANDPWSPPLFLLAHLAARAVADALERGTPANVLWIGRAVWPYPRALSGNVDVVESHGHGTSGLLQLTLELREASPTLTDEHSGSIEHSTLFDSSLFIDPHRKNAGETLWAIDTALRCPSVTAIVADGTGLGMAATRRLQLAAAQADALVLLARPPCEIGEVSAATTRWAVTREADPNESTSEAQDAHGLSYWLRWRAELLRAKGAQMLLRGKKPTHHERRSARSR